MKVYPENKKHDLCVISIENQFLVIFRWTQRSITQRRVITLSPIFFKMVLNWAQGLKKKSHVVSARKNNNRLRNNKKCRGEGGFCPPGSFRVKWTVIDKISRNGPQFHIIITKIIILKYNWSEIDQLPLPYKVYGKDMSEIYFFHFCQLWAVKRLAAFWYIVQEAEQLLPPRAVKRNIWHAFQ